MRAPVCGAFSYTTWRAADFLRQALIDRLQGSGVDSIERQAILLAWAETKLAGISSSSRARVVELARKLYLDDPAPGVHSAAELLLCAGGRRKFWRIVTCSSVNRRNAPRARTGRWANGHTFAILRSPLHFRMGSPKEEEGREGPIEEAHERQIDRTLAVSTTEVTFDQFHKFQSRETTERPLCPNRRAAR